MLIKRIVRTCPLFAIQTATRRSYTAAAALTCNTVLAIETSCDDTCLSILECDGNISSSPQKPRIVFERIKRSLDQHEAYGGIHPLVAVRSHDVHVPHLVEEAMAHLKLHRRKLDLICVTKGPGMRASLQVGIDAAERLADQLKVPLLGVHHMQAHALTPRLLQDGPAPGFPYLSLLASGGHTLLLVSRGVTDHAILATTLDIAIGDMLDKVAKALCIPWHGIMPGAALERWCRDDEASAKQGRYVPMSVSDKQQRAWRLTRPLHAKVNVDGERFEHMAFSFSGLGYSIVKLLKQGDWTEANRRALGGEAMRLAFEHLAAKMTAFLSTLAPTDWPTAFVVSGGVARNQYLRETLERSLSTLSSQTRGATLPLIAPPLDLCSDNATMIAWAGYEMFQQGQTPSMTPMVPRPKWPLDLLMHSDASFEEEMQRRLSESILIRRSRQNLMPLGRKTTLASNAI